MSKNQEEVSILDKRRLVAFLGHYRDLVKVNKVKLYSSGKDGEHWLDSGLEGFFCFVTDKEFKTRFFVMYAYTTYEKLFEMELFLNFNSYFTSLTDTFCYFEFNEGFLGLKFTSAENATMFKIVVNKFDDKLLAMLMAGDPKSKNNKEIVNRNITVLKEKFTNSKSQYDKNYCESGLLIVKPLYFEFLNNISYNKEKKMFMVEGEDTKQLLKSIGFKKSEMKNTKLALDIFKQMIITLENLDDCPTTANKNTRKPHKFNAVKFLMRRRPSHNKAGTLNTKEPDNEGTKHPQTQNTSNAPGLSNIPNVPNIPNIPKVPNIPGIPNIPNIPKVPNIPNIPNIPKVPNIPNIPNIPKIPNIVIPSTPGITTVDSNDEGKDAETLKKESLLKVVLKKAEVIEEPALDSRSQMKLAIEKGVKLTKAAPQEQKKITLNDKNLLSMTLSLALEQRRKDMGDTKKEEDEDSDWSS